MAHFKKVLENEKARKFVIDNTDLIPNYTKNEIHANMIFIITCIKELKELSNEVYQKNQQISFISLIINILYTSFEVFDLNGIHADSKLDYKFFLREDRVKNITQSTLKLDEMLYECNDGEMLDLLKNIKYSVEYAIEMLVPTQKQPTTVILSKEDKLVYERIELIFAFVEEIEEFESKWDTPEICEILANLIYVLYDTFTLFNINVDKAFDILHESNLTTLCENEDVATKSVRHYIHTKEYSNPAIMKLEYADQYVVYNKATNKILKSIEYKKPDFSGLLEL